MSNSGAAPKMPEAFANGAGPISSLRDHQHTDLPLTGLDRSPGAGRKTDRFHSKASLAYSMTNSLETQDQSGQEKAGIPAFFCLTAFLQ
ncbi:hypothetical protein DWY99_01255 [[Clostridium] leptum]|uniref:Uncharacterized protein n=1 Tax=[Clostridium] leptum TaxID=1535 RepID=A0A412B101_9FIRM|nr:hypothetical protein DWY99_01255 [[Clostridium] leptum]